MYLKFSLQLLAKLCVNETMFGKHFCISGSSGSCSIRCVKTPKLFHVHVYQSDYYPVSCLPLIIGKTQMLDFWPVFFISYDVYIDCIVWCLAWCISWCGAACLANLYPICVRLEALLAWLRLASRMHGRLTGQSRCELWCLNAISMSM